MTYSLIEKEATIYEQQIDELFNLTEKEAEVSYTDKDGRTWTGDNNYINTIKFADDNDHYMTMYKGLPPPQQGTTGIQPHVTGDDTDGQGGGTDPPDLIPPLRVNPKKVVPKKVAPTKPKLLGEPKKVAPTKPKRLDGPKKVAPTKPKRLSGPERFAPTKPKRLSGPERFAPTKPKLLGEPKKVAPQKAIPHKVPQKVISTKPLSQRNKIAANMAQGEIDDIFRKLQNKNTTLPQGRKLLKQLNNLKLYKKPLRLNISNDIPKRFVTKPKLDAPKIELPKLNLTTPDAPEIKLPKSDEKDRIAKIAKDAIKKVKTVDTSTAHLVGDDGKSIDDKTSTKTKTQVGVDPSAKSDMAKGMVQPKEGQGIKSFAKQLGYNTVEEFEKANPKGVGVDKKTGNKFVKTGVSYIDQQAFGVANELANAKSLLKKAQNAKKPNPARIAKLEKQVNAYSGKTAKPHTVVGKPAPGIKDMRKMSFAKGLSYSKVYATLAKRAAAKGLAKAGGYLVPGLNIALLAWDAHELVVGTAGITSAYGSWDRQGKQQDLNQINAILDSEATIAEKRKAIEAFGEGKELTHRFQPKGAKKLGHLPGEQGGKRWDKDGDEHDPPLPFELKNINGRKMDINTVPIEKYEEVIANHVTENMAPYTQKDLNVLINRIETMKEYAISGGRRKATQRQIDAYDAKIKKLVEIRKTYPKSRKNAFKNLFTMMVDVHEQEQAKGEVYDFTNKKTETGSALENALARAYEADMKGFDKQNVRRKGEQDAGFMSFSNWGQSSVGRFVDNTIDGIAGDGKPSYAYIEPGSKDDPRNIDNTATAGMSVTPTPSQNNDPSVVTTVGTPYGNNPGAPANFREYETLMQDVSTSFDLPIAVVRALAMQESGMHVTNKGKLGPWSYTGDHTLGKKGAFGPFHVRSDPDKGASLEHYNEVKGTTYTWKDIASNGMLAAKVGATYFKHWYDKTGGDAQKAYELYNGGPSGYMKTQSIANAKKFKERLDKFNESRNFANKSAILEGMALAT